MKSFKSEEKQVEFYVKQLGVHIGNALFEYTYFPEGTNKECIKELVPYFSCLVDNQEGEKKCKKVKGNLDDFLQVVIEKKNEELDKKQFEFKEKLGVFLSCVEGVKGIGEAYSEFSRNSTLDNLEKIYTELENTDLIKDWEGDICLERILNTYRETKKYL